MQFFAFMNLFDTLGGEQYMSMPNIPEISPKININMEEVINLLLASIAMEELGLAHIINSEGEKIQCITDDGKCCKLDELVEIDKSVQKTLKTVIKKEMLLEFKFENILDLIEKHKK